TTIWERWDGWTAERGFQDPGMNSFNHYALGAIGAWLYRTVAGIDTDPERPGYRHIVFHPRPGGGLTHARAELRSPYGPITSHWTIAGDTFTLRVAVPPNTTATLRLPAVSADDVAEGDRPARHAPGVRLVGQDGGEAAFALDSGDYTFVTRRIT
ncbi:MAG TPA: alpha-L-rhamnosidase C-terminal domain-containing protein, partial [Thermomicrobiales bacterium]|nr:alpha-L-rhamnosidase C-terminal domain-containing protein [Thermomicrobiales bacterium]